MPIQGDRTLTTTHLAAAVLIGLLLNLNRDEWFVALTFGVFIDADHLFALPRHVSDNGWAALLWPSWDDGSGLPWRSLLHQPIGFFVVAPLAIGWRYMLPLLFWGVHVGMDELQMATLEHSAVIESTLLAAVCSGILALQYRRWVALSPGSGFTDYLDHLWARTRSVLFNH